MNSKTLAKIEAAAPFLIRFRKDVPDHLQELIAPYLDQPYQMTLKILDCCMSGSPVSLDEISARTGISKATVRQVLNVVQENGIQLQVEPKRWLIVAEEPGQMATTAGSV